MNISTLPQSFTAIFARPLLAAPFVLDGIDAVRHPEEHAAKLTRLEPVLDNLGLPTPSAKDAATLAKVSGAVAVWAGANLALGRRRRVSALTLLALSVPLAVAQNPVWFAADDAERERHVQGLTRSAALAGGLLLETTR